MPKVRITTGDHTIELEHDEGSANDLAKLAQQLWRQTITPADTGTTHRGQIGFATTDRAGYSWAERPELNPYR